MQQLHMDKQLTRQDIIPRIRPRLMSAEYQASQLASLIKSHLAADIWLTWYADMAGLIPEGQLPKDACPIAPVTTDFADRFKLTIGVLLQIGAANASADYTARPMNDVLGMLCNASLPTDGCPSQLYVLTNAAAHYGAAAVLDPDIQQQLAATFDDGFLLLPSSTHEFLAVPSTGDESQAQDLAQMVRAINHDETIMHHEDILSDHVYRITDGRLAVAV